MPDFRSFPGSAAVKTGFKKTGAAGLVLGVAGALVLSACDSPASANLVRNGSFDVNTASWFASSNASLGLSPDGHTGPHAARVRANSPGTSVLNDDPNTVTSTTAGTNYHATAWVRTISPGVYVTLRMMEYAGTTYKGQGAAGVWLQDTAWHQVVTDYKAVSSGASIDVNIVGSSMQAGQSFDADDVSVTTGGGAAAAAPQPAPQATPQPQPQPQPQPSSSGSTGSSGCAVSARLVSSCGALWGFYSSGNSLPAVEQMQTNVGRRFDVVKRYHDFSNWGGNGVFPSSDEAALVAGGQTLHIAWETKLYGSRDPALPVPAGSYGSGHNNVYTYSQITSGQLNSYIDATAARIRALGKPVFMDLDHEADDSTTLGGSNASRAAAGTPEEFKAAYRYLVQRFRADGATNAVWVFTVSGYQSSDSVYQRLYPGDDVVDWIGWDPYNHYSGAPVMPFDLFNRFYQRLDAGMLGAAAAAKPRMLSEYGSMAYAGRPDWMRAIPAALRQLPKLKSVEYFCSGSWGDFTSDATSLAAYRQAGLDSYVHTNG